MLKGQKCKLMEDSTDKPIKHTATGIIIQFISACVCVYSTYISPTLLAACKSYPKGYYLERHLNSKPLGNLLSTHTTTEPATTFSRGVKVQPPHIRYLELQY